jgi:glycosyltransferase involved in cell wall biosynthesis
MLHYQSQITTVFTLANGFGSQSRELKVIQRQSNGKVKVLFVGADTSAKGFPLFVSLAEKYGGTNSNFNFVAAGGAKRSEASNVQQLGVISPNDLQLELESAALLVVPSRVEAMPMVILEAMKNRVPVLASPVGDIPEVLSFGSVGVLFDGSWESLDLSFQHFAANQSEFVRISERAYTKWQNEYTAEAMFNRHLNFWRQSTKRVRFKRAF